MKLYLYRFSLKHRPQKDAFERKKENGDDYSREEWIREIFSRDFTFIHHGNIFFFVPESSENTGIDENIIVGWIARDRPVAERTAPWEGLSPTEHQSWRASLIMIDPTHHDDGQKVAFEYRGEVGQPNPVISSLARHVSELGVQEPYSLTAYPIIEDRSFARFAEAHKGEISTIFYDVAMPNMFGGPDDFSEEMRYLRDSANVSRVRTQLKGDGVLNTESTQINEIASHVEKGGGRIKARTIKGTRYNSDDHAVSADVDVDGERPESPSYWARIKGAIDRIF